MSYLKWRFQFFSRELEIKTRKSLCKHLVNKERPTSLDNKKRFIKVNIFFEKYIHDFASTNDFFFGTIQYDVWIIDSVEFRLLPWPRTLLVRVTVKNISCGDRLLILVLRTQFSQWRGGLRCFIFIWARVLSLLVFRPAVVAACFFFHVRSPSRCWSHMICSTVMRGIFAWLFDIFTRGNSSERANMLTRYIPPNRGLHLWCLPISIASRCGILNLFHKCCNHVQVAPRSEGELQFCRVHDIPLFTNMKHHSEQRTATIRVLAQPYTECRHLGGLRLKRPTVRGLCEANWRNGLKQLKHVPRKLHSQKAKIRTLCGLWHKNPTVMRQRLFVTTASLGRSWVCTPNTKRCIP